MTGITGVDESMMNVEAIPNVDSKHSLSQPLHRPGASRREQECNYTLEHNFVMDLFPRKQELGCFNLKAAADLKSKYIFSHDGKQVPRRVHTRVMYTSGRPLKHFKHLRELLWVTRDVIEG